VAFPDDTYFAVMVLKAKTKDWQGYFVSNVLKFTVSGKKFSKGSIVEKAEIPEVVLRTIKNELGKIASFEGVKETAINW